MTKEQRFRYEMFARIADFGASNAALFPESTAGGQLFAQVREMVNAIENYLTKRDLARAEAQQVKTATRSAVITGLRVVSAAARRVAVVESGANPFRMPARKSAPVLLSRARLFIDEARKRQDQFARVGVLPTFINAFEAQVNQLDQAVSVQQGSRSRRGNAQAGIENTLVRCFAVVRDLEVAVKVVLHDDPVRMAGWRAARRLEGLQHLATGADHAHDDEAAPGAEPVATPDAPSVAPAAAPPDLEKAS